MDNPVPAIGRLVHFEIRPGECRPAMMVRIWGNSPDSKTAVNLTVFPDWTNDSHAEGMFWKTSQVEQPKGSSWGYHWPHQCK